MKNRCDIERFSVDFSRVAREKFISDEQLEESDRSSQLIKRSRRFFKNFLVKNVFCSIKCKVFRKLILKNSFIQFFLTPPKKLICTGNKHEPFLERKVHVKRVKSTKKFRIPMMNW